MIIHFTIGLFDDDGRYLNLNGNRYTSTLQITIEHDENRILDLPRFLPQLQSYINIESVGNSTRITKSQPKNEISGGPNKYE
jgi:hypothetical protein